MSNRLGLTFTDGNDAFVKLYALISKHGEQGHSTKFLKNISFTDMEDVYKRVGKKIPMQMFWGEKDQNIPYLTYKKVKEAVPGIEFNGITGGGHIPQYTHPEFVNPPLKDFIKKK